MACIIPGKYHGVTIDCRFEAFVFHCATDLCAFGHGENFYGNLHPAMLLRFLHVKGITRVRFNLRLAFVCAQRVSFVAKGYKINTPTNRRLIWGNVRGNVFPLNRRGSHIAEGSGEPGS